MEELEDDFDYAEPKEYSPYGKFWHDNIGFEWLDKKTGKLIGKGNMFLKFGDYPVILEKLTKEGHENFVRVQKEKK